MNDRIKHYSDKIDNSTASSFMYNESAGMPILQELWNEAFAAGVASVKTPVTRTMKMRRLEELELVLFNNTDNPPHIVEEYVALHKELFPYKH